jgi:hypothetical protein
MDPNYQLPPEWRFKPQPEESECFKCSFRGRVDRTACPRCGKRLYTESNIRMRGVLLIAIGIFLALFMGAIAVGVFLLLASVRDKDSVRRINDSLPMLIGVFGIFAAVIAYGVNSVVMGLWQAITGRRNKALIWLMWAMLSVMLIGGAVFRIFAD